MRCLSQASVVVVVLSVFIVFESAMPICAQDENEQQTEVERLRELVAKQEQELRQLEARLSKLEETHKVLRFDEYVEAVRAAEKIGPVEPTGRPVSPTTALSAGDRVLVEWGESWWNGTVLQLAPSGEVKVHYEGWDAEWDEVVPRTRLQLPANKLPGCPDWLANYAFKQEHFTFARIQFTSVGERAPGAQAQRTRGPWARRGKWATDYPDADICLSEKLRRHMSLKVAPEGKVLKLTDPTLSEYPFIYMAEPGSVVLTDEEVAALRGYLLDGGFLMLDDFWGEDEWEQLNAQLRRVLPDREFQELPLDHALFHCVFDLQEKPQVPSIAVALSGRTTERVDGSPVHYRALFDDAGRMMVLACHNTDLADGWERQEEHEYYKEFGEKKAYPMAFNIIFFALTQ